MKKKHNLYIFAVILALVAALMYMQTSSPDGTTNTQIQGIKVEVAGTQLTYPSTYGTYEKSSSPYTKTTNTVVWYENTESNKNFFSGTPNAPTEPPTTMTLDVYTNPDNLEPRKLLEGYTPYMFAKGEGRQLVLGGVPAQLFEWDGLYKGRSIMVTRNGFTYVFSVTAITQEDQILKDFDLLLSSVSFK
ncbi:MAG: hypothetical protein KBC21_01760 [Candidatus Pacebacteria bacterium]|nr:hypothetical protein [Candidatus Paceibacterota bacterium]